LPDPVAVTGGDVASVLGGVMLGGGSTLVFGMGGSGGSLVSGGCGLVTGGVTDVAIGGTLGLGFGSTSGFAPTTGPGGSGGLMGLPDSVPA
jgi:hypothetical protein